ncbi:hypothetical protein [Arthrobacter sp. Z4-13]
MGSKIVPALTALEPLGVEVIGLSCAPRPDDMSEEEPRRAQLSLARSSFPG